MNYNQGTRVYNFLTWSKQKLKSLRVSKTKPGVLSVSMFSIFLKAEKNICWTKSFDSIIILDFSFFKKKLTSVGAKISNREGNKKI